MRLIAINFIKSYFFILLLCYFVPEKAFSMTQNEEQHPFYFLSLADIHFNPFISCRNAIPCPLIQKLNQAPSRQWAKILITYDTEAQRYTEDTHYQLFKSTLMAAKKAVEAENAQFVIVLGDFLGHTYYRLYKKYSSDKSIVGYRSFVRKTLEFMTSEFAEAFPTLDVYVTVGNNDSYQGDYHCECNGAFFNDAKNTWATLIKNKNNRLAMQREFPQGGYYAVDIPKQPLLKLIVLNSVIFSTNARGKNVNQAADDELKWLHQQLESVKTKQQKAFIVMHIPMGTDMYATFRIRFFRLMELWKTAYTERFQAELQMYSAQIAGIFAGHLHSDWYQSLTYNQNEIPMTGTTSVSPIFGNNPGFKIYSYNLESKQLKDFALYYYPLNGDKIWAKEYSLNHDNPLLKWRPVTLASLGMWPNSPVCF